MAKLFIASEYVDSESKETTPVRNPATGEIVDTVPKGTVNDIRRAIDVAKGAARWPKPTPYRLYTKRVVHWVWVSTSSMMFRRSLIDLVFPEDDEAFRLHMDFYVVVMAHMVAGCLLIDEALYDYRLHGRNGAADNPVLGGRLHLSSRNWGNTYGQMLDRMLASYDL